MNEDTKHVLKKLDGITELLQKLVALELAKGGASREQIARHLHLATAKVVQMLKGIKNEK